ncbi:MAG TPA: HAD family hydrolase, partial [Bacteroidetes bacterium]|nr:HAD family hydrolase [Bacteroidota bacterium]
MQDRNTTAAMPFERGIFCNRTLNLRSIRAIGYDMDYTLVHYRVDEWEGMSYHHLKEKLLAEGWPVEELEFDPQLVMRGLIIDRELGNLVKANRFGYIKRACHGTRPVPFEEQRRQYARTLIDLHEDRWVFLNTLFSLSEGSMYAQLVDLLDQRRLPAGLGYAELQSVVRRSIDLAHMEGQLKADILADPGRFITPDPETPLALLDQKHAGRKLMLITNSDWPYTQAVMSYSFDPHLGGGMTWRDLFDLVICSAGKPGFFARETPAYEVVNPEGLLRPVVGPLKAGSVYVGGHAGLVEELFGLSGEQILYVGDHMY